MITAVDPKTRTAQTFVDMVKFTSALEQGWVPILADGSPAKTYTFEGGYLVQGAPLNTWFQGAWFEGQQEILKPHWDSGEIVIPPADVMSLPVIPVPSDVLTTYAAFKQAPAARTLVEAYQTGASSLSSILQSPITLAAIGIGLLLVFGGSSGRSRRAESSDFNV